MRGSSSRTRFCAVRHSWCPSARIFGSWRKWKQSLIWVTLGCVSIRSSLRYINQSGVLPEQLTSTVKLCLCVYNIPEESWALDLSCCCCWVSQSRPTLCNPMDCNIPGFPVLHYLLEFVQTYVHWVGEAIQPSHLLSSPFAPAVKVFPGIRVFSNELALCIRWPKYWSFSISPSNEYSRLISFRIEWFDLLAVQGNLKNLLQHHSLKASVLWHSAFFIQLLELSKVVEMTYFYALQCDSPSHMWHQHLKRS